MKALFFASISAVSLALASCSRQSAELADLSEDPHFEVESISPHIAGHATSVSIIRHRATGERYLFVNGPEGVALERMGR